MKHRPDRQLIRFARQYRRDWQELVASADTPIARARVWLYRRVLRELQRRGLAHRVDPNPTRLDAISAKPINPAGSFDCSRAFYGGK